MGTRGPARTPTEILRKRGSWLADRNPNEPTPERGRPVCPRWISKSAKRVWKDLIPVIDAMGVLALVDRNALTRYCQLFSRWRDAEEFLAKHGTTYPVKDPNGELKMLRMYPQAKVADQLAVQLNRLEQQFGLTPAARSRLVTEKREEEPKDGKRKFIKFA